MGVTPDESRGLRRLDDTLVPRLQRLARPVGQALGAPGRWLRALDRGTFGGRPARFARDHRGTVAFLTVALIFGAAYVNFERYPDLREAERVAAVDQARPGSAASETDQDTGTTAVGPAVGTSVDEYLAARRDALAAAPAGDQRVAVVSFGAFLAPNTVADLLARLEVSSLQYQFPERSPRPAQLDVDDDMVASTDRVITSTISDVQAEEDEVRSLLDSGVESAEFEADYEARLDELVALRNTLTQDPRVVFAAVARGSVADLRRLASDPQVRLVDLAPAGTEVAGTGFYGILPTATDRFEYGQR